MAEIIPFVLGPLENNTYVVRDQQRCLVIDPALGSEELVQWLVDEQLQVVAVLLTHGHFDHIMGLPALQERFGELPVYLHPADQDFLSDPALNGSTLIGQPFRLQAQPIDLQTGLQQVEGFQFEVLHLPGHTPGGCGFLFDQTCICGDSLFRGSIGRTDLAGGDTEQLLTSLRTTLMDLDDGVELATGHGPLTQVGQERLTNPFLR